MALARELTLTGVLALAAAAPSLAQPLVAMQSPSAAAAGQMQVGRYTTTLAEPAAEAGDPLAVQARLTYPRQTVHTVGDAVRHTLMRTGWSLVDASALEAEAARFLQLPLPESQRTLGPYDVRTLLRVLTSSVWIWHEDPVRRLLWFTLAQAQAQVGTTTADTTDAIADAVQTTPVSPLEQVEVTPLPDTAQAQPDRPVRQAPAVMPSAGEN